MDIERPPLPTYVKYEEGISDISGQKTCREYLEKVLEVYVRDTPFRQTDLCGLHDELVERSVPGDIPYKTSTVQRELLRMRKDGLILIFDGYTDKDTERLFFWAEGIPELTKIRDKEEPVEPDHSVVEHTIEMEKADSVTEPTCSQKVQKHNALTPFFSSLFRKALGL